MGLGSRRVLVQSGLYRDRSEVYSRTGAGDVAFGFAPTGRISVWTEAATAFEQGTAGAPACTFLNETAFEVYRGLWLKFSPQLRTTAGDASAGVARLLFEAYVLPRTHWNLDMSFYRDRDRSTDFVTSIFPIQLHLYL
jgi:hypothetical protein